MFFSMYPTDTESSQQEIVALVEQYGEFPVFTSLHIPEATGLWEYVEKLKKLHQQKGFTFCADISPHTLGVLEISIENIAQLKEYGIHCLRIDFGFSLEEVEQIAKQGFSIAVNASTVDEEFIRALKKFHPIGWHNYYPRPETGLSISYFQAQNALFHKNACALVGFIPGDRCLRAPLYLGLPMLEVQRHVNTYVNYMRLRQAQKDMSIYLAEGTAYRRHLDWISKWENEGIISLPVYMEDELFRQFENRVFTLRPEMSTASFRLEGTRGVIKAPKEGIHSDGRFKGSIQMDTNEYGRYEGEIHLMRSDTLIDHKTVYVGEIQSNYLGIVDCLQGKCKIQFVR